MTMADVVRIHPEYTGEQCEYCGQWFPFPVMSNHTFEECCFWQDYEVDQLPYPRPR